MRCDVAPYADFLARKADLGAPKGFEPIEVPAFLFPFQRALVEWAIRRGRAALFADCGLGKTPMQLVWADNVVRFTGRPVLILTPLAVAPQTIREATKFGIDAVQSRDGTPGRHVTVTNYEQLAKFRPEDFAGVVCDESSILKSYGGATRKRITRFVSKMEFRLLCTATAAPNDFVELGTSSEALGELNYSEMLKRFFQQLDDKGQKRERQAQDEAESVIADDPNYYRKLAFRVAQTIGQWRLRHHAVVPFWRWVASWSRVCRKPSDLGFEDGPFVLPPLVEREHVVAARSLPPGMLFNVPAFGMAEEREERRRTLAERCEFVAGLVDHGRPAVVWCHMNPEGDLLERTIPGAAQVSGKTPDARKVELFEAFRDGSLRVLVLKPKIGAWGLNWQHCAHVVTFASHSYEQYYQLVRRCWRFGQANPVAVDLVATEGELRVIGNVRRKAGRADRMFAALVREMGHAARVERHDPYVRPVEAPRWLSSTNS